MKLKQCICLIIAMVVLSLVSIACESESGGGEAATTYSPGEKVSANNGSLADLQAAFEHAGIGNARKWAREVDEYRPYAEDDTDYLKLRGELTKYNPGPGVVDEIIAQLELP